MLCSECKFLQLLPRESKSRIFKDFRRSKAEMSFRKAFTDAAVSHFHETFISARNWMIFLNERAPPLVFLMMTAGPILTAMHQVQGFVEWEKFFFGMCAQFVLLLTVRLMDDVKDYELDKVIHPERPLPRGLLRYNDVCAAIRSVLEYLLLLAGIMALRFNVQVGALFATQVVYAALMYVEFFLGKWFEEWVLLYALTHQFNIYIGSFFLVALSGGQWDGWSGFWIGTLGFSGFFTYEVCRKLDPSLPRRKGTYLIVYGKKLTFLILSLTLLFGAVAAHAIASHWFLWPMQALMLASVLILFLLPPEQNKPKRHKIVELLSVVYMLVHFWSGTIDHFFK